MDSDGVLALTSAGGIVTLTVGAVLARFLGWPGTGGATGTSPPALPWLAVAGFLAVALLAAVAWGNGLSNSRQRTYW